MSSVEVTVTLLPEAIIARCAAVSVILCLWTPVVV